MSMPAVPTPPQNAGLLGQFLADAHVSAQGIGVSELVGVEGARIFGQFFRAFFHFLVKLRHQLAALGWKYFQICAEKTHGPQLLVGKSVRGYGREAVALDGAHHGER
jgi:hypothetical protein